jgi:hypothetical protein
MRVKIKLEYLNEGNTHHSFLSECGYPLLGECDGRTSLKGNERGE